MIGGRVYEPQWDGRGPLTEWPLVDWAIFHDETWQPIWNYPPRTSCWKFARLIREDAPRFDPATYIRPFAVSSKPRLVRVLEPRPLHEPKGHAVWRITTGARVNTQSRVKVAASEIRERVDRQPVDQALRELMFAEQLQPDSAMSLCPTTNKVKHRSRLWALQHRLRLAMLPDELHPERLQAYKCRWCGAWHVGHNNATGAR